MEYTFQELVQLIKHQTDPRRLDNADTLIDLLNEGDVFTMVIVEMRKASREMHRIIDDVVGDGDPHGESARKEFGDTVRKLDKNILRMIHDYARHIENIDGCRCVHCQRSAAANN